MKPNSVKIRIVLNGWKVSVGCQEVVFTDKETLLSELSKYLDDPAGVQSRYTNESVNSKIVVQGEFLWLPRLPHILPREFIDDAEAGE